MCFEFGFVLCSLNIHTVAQSGISVLHVDRWLNPVMHCSDYSVYLNSINY